MRALIATIVAALLGCPLTAQTASVQDLGQRCAASGSPGLTATPPVVGQFCTITYAGNNVCCLVPATLTAMPLLVLGVAPVPYQIPGWACSLAFQPVLTQATSGIDPIHNLFGTTVTLAVPPLYGFQFYAQWVTITSSCQPTNTNCVVNSVKSSNAARLTIGV